MQKLLFDIFNATTLTFSSITLAVSPSASKFVGGCYLHINQTFYHCNQTMVYFVRFFSSEASNFFSNTYALTNVRPRTTTTSAPYLPFNRMLLRSHYTIFCFSCNSVRYNSKRWENLLNFSTTVKKGNTSLINFLSFLTLGS